MSIAYDDIGPRDGRAIVLLHAWGFGRQAWDRQSRAWSTDNRIIAVDLRGHGDSDKPTSALGPDRLADDAVAVLDHLGLSSASLVGWSLGGAVAVRIASRYPSRVERLVLVAPFGPKYLAGENNPYGVPTEIAEGALSAEALSGEEFRLATIDQMPKSPYSEGLRHALMTLALRAPTWSAGVMLDEFMQHDLGPELPSVRALTLICQGRADAIAPAERVQQYQAGISNARIAWFEESGHSPNLEETAQFNTIVSQFVNQT
ncbi:alpha/beta fold hydrolase [Gordonia terrae]|uniref:alpha/beta fold hydrolase n=1 Tax=Gordonia terrae TaxID=2055 RepID=UPI0012FDB885|nr:alpha/beta hydrolase [Gordonia terrae]